MVGDASHGDAERGYFSLSGLACASAIACIGAGAFTDGFYSNTPFAPRWNGRGWSDSKAARPSAITSQLSGIACPSPTSCFASGGLSSGPGPAGYPHPFLDRLERCEMVGCVGTGDLRRAERRCVREHDELPRDRRIAATRGRGHQPVPREAEHPGAAMGRPDLDTGRHTQSVVAGGQPHAARSRRRGDCPTAALVRSADHKAMAAFPGSAGSYPDHIGSRRRASRSTAEGRKPFATRYTPSENSRVAIGRARIPLRAEVRAHQSNRTPSWAMMRRGAPINPSTGSTRGARRQIHLVVHFATNDSLAQCTCLDGAGSTPSLSEISTEEKFAARATRRAAVGLQEGAAASSTFVGRTRAFRPWHKTVACLNLGSCQERLSCLTAGAAHRLLRLNATRRRELESP